MDGGVYRQPHDWSTKESTVTPCPCVLRGDPLGDGSGDGSIPPRGRAWNR